MLFWGHTAEEPPEDRMTIGHENTGFVVAKGKNVTGIQIGDAVGCLGCSFACCESIFFHCSQGIGCHLLIDWHAVGVDDCEGCQVHNLFCEKGTGRMHGFSCHGHFAEYSISDYRNAMVLPDGMDMITAAPLFCAGITGEYCIEATF